jgi:hypothetical protein
LRPERQIKLNPFGLPCVLLFVKRSMAWGRPKVTRVDRLTHAPLKCFSFVSPPVFRVFDRFRPEESTVSLVKIIVITIAIILSIFLFGRFLF